MKKYLPVRLRKKVPVAKCKRPGVHHWIRGVCRDCTNGTRRGDRRTPEQIARDRQLYNPKDNNVRWSQDYLDVGPRDR